MTRPLEYTYIPLPFWDEETGDWKPSVKVLSDGQFMEWLVFDLGFHEPRFTLPYARQFVAEMAQWHRLIIARWMQEQGIRNDSQ